MITLAPGVRISTSPLGAALLRLDAGSLLYTAARTLWSAPTAEPGEHQVVVVAAAPRSSIVH